MVVKDNLLVIRMDVAGLTQWGTSWLRERVCGKGGFERIVEISEKKSKAPPSAKMGHPPARIVLAFRGRCPPAPMFYPEMNSSAAFFIILERTSLIHLIRMISSRRAWTTSPTLGN